MSSNIIYDSHFDNPLISKLIPIAIPRADETFAYKNIGFWTIQLSWMESCELIIKQPLSKTL